MTQSNHHEADIAQSTPEAEPKPSRRLMAMLGERIEYKDWLSVSGDPDSNMRTRSDTVMDDGSWTYDIVQNGHQPPNGDIVAYPYFQVKARWTSRPSHTAEQSLGVFDVDADVVELVAPSQLLLDKIRKSGATPAEFLIGVLEAAGENEPMLRRRIDQLQRLLQRQLHEMGLLEPLSDRDDVALLQEAQDPDHALGILFTPSGLMVIERHHFIGRVHVRDMVRFNLHGVAESATYLAGQKEAPPGTDRGRLRKIVNLVQGLYDGLMDQRFTTYDPTHDRLVGFDRDEFNAAVQQINNQV